MVSVLLRSVMHRLRRQDRAPLHAQVSRGGIEALLNRRDLAVLERLVADDVAVYFPHDQPPRRGRRHVAALVRLLHIRMPGVSVTVAYLRHTERSIVMRVEVRQGDDPGFGMVRPAPVIGNAIVLVQAKDGRIVEVWVRPE